MIRVAFGSVPKDGGTFTFYRTLRPLLLEAGIDMRCVSVGRAQAALIEAAFADDGCVTLAAECATLKAQARAFAEWCMRERMDIVMGVNSPAILSALPHLPQHVRALARCANGFDEGYRLTLIGRDRLARIVALVPRLRDDLVAGYGVDPDRISLIPNGCDPVRFDAAAATERGRGARLELGFLGRLEHSQKGVMHLPALVARLDRAGSRFRLSIAGKGRDEPALRAALAEYVANGRVIFAGPLPPQDIPGFLAATDVFLFPSHFEGCPNALLEAMMAGAVPVAWRLRGITDFLIEDGRTGFLAEPGDVAALSDAVIRLDRDRRGALGALSCAVASEARARFSAATCAQAYRRLFEEVMAEPAPAGIPVPWRRFRPDPLFRSHPLARLVPPSQRQRLRTLTRTLRGSAGRAPAIRPERAARRLHQIINSVRPERGGAERMVLQLHEGFRRAGEDARLVVLETSPTESIAGARSLGFASPYDPRIALRLAACLRETVPGDIVHVHLFPASAHIAALARAGTLRGRHLIFTEHSTSNRRRKHALGGVVDDRVYPAFRKIVAISAGVESELLRARPWLSGRTMVIENGCPLPFSAPPDRRPGATLRILSVGRLTPAKNYAAALRAVARLGDREIRYVIAGEGPERPALERLTAELALGNRVEFAGYVADIPAALAAADIFLIPSAWEGFGLAAVEAMNAGLPVIASDVPGLRDVVGTDGRAARLVDPADPEAIAAALVWLVDHAEARTAMGAEGAARSRRFDIRHCLDAHLRLYEHLRGQPCDAA